ncbi:hypothetical protein MmiHf6_02570 [Methanimicrococcus hongohii]|uniref:Peptidase M10 metallopeptidase domain-containing protein n=1 Tax=Methanimicrococcus hongohii TaxID=3028295 RepID=A0AA96UZJ9_9EURY|nr:matrixin family metalloprotease [Methanimicrococcus sp. Hf6]WNY22963.1 hypothetical protein MmiHf6_02570 [Methanimicrococcus sp. Hf6]
MKIKAIFLLFVVLLLIAAPMNVATAYKAGNDKWFSVHIPVQVSYSSMPSGWHNAITKAMDSWSYAGANFSFENYSGAYLFYVNIKQGQLSDYETLATESGSHGILYSDGKRQKWGSNITVNSQRSFSTYGASNTHDIESVILHELGHSLCLGDINSPTTSVMYRSLSIEQMKRVLTQDDIDGIKAIYG